MYLDDILIFSDSREDHLKHLWLVMTELKENERYVGMNKYELMKHEAKFMGMVVGNSAIRIEDDPMKLVRKWPTPANIT